MYGNAYRVAASKQSAANAPAYDFDGGPKYNGLPRGFVVTDPKTGKFRRHLGNNLWEEVTRGASGEGWVTVPSPPQPQQAAPAPQRPPSPAPAPPVPAAQQPAQPQAAAPQQATAYAPPRPQTAAGQAPMKLPKQGQAQPIPPRTQGTQMVAPPKPAGQGSIPWMNSQAQPAPQQPGPFMGGDAMPYGQPWPGRAQQQHMPAPQPQYQQQMAMPAQPAPMEDAGGAWQVDERRKSAYHQQLLDRIAELEAPRPNQNNPWRTDNQKIKRAGLAAEHNAAAWDRQQAWEAEDRAKTLKRLQQIREQHYGQQAPSSQGAASGISAPRFAG